MYRGGLLASWFDTEENARAAHRMADIGRARLHELIVLHTPVDTGHLRTTWKDEPIVVVVDERGEIVYRTGVFTEDEIAPYVEHGTGLWGPRHAKYEIRPKKPGGMLHFLTPEGAHVFTKLVRHPGSPGAHMVAISVGELEAALPALLQAELELWAWRVERQNHSDRGMPRRA